MTEDQADRIEWQLDQIRKLLLLLVVLVILGGGVVVLVNLP